MMIRSAANRDVGSIGRIYTDSWRAVYKDVLPSDYLASLTYEHAAAKWAKYLALDGHFIFVADDDSGMVVAFAAGKLRTEVDGCGLLDSVHVSQGHKGRGIGKTLIGMAADHLMRKGIERMMICAVVGNDDAIRIYEHLGARHLRDFVDCFDGVRADSVALVWDDLAALRRRLNKEAGH